MLSRTETQQRKKIMSDKIRQTGGRRYMVNVLPVKD
jgi:hypothetical protein